MKIVSIAVSKKKGTRKTQVEEAAIVLDHGLDGDAHAGPWHRQVSFLASESIEKAREQGLDVTFGALMAMYNETGDSRWFPPLLLRRKVKAGHLGRKTGKGWYEYDADGNKKKGN